MLKNDSSAIDEFFEDDFVQRWNNENSLSLLQLAKHN